MSRGGGLTEGFEDEGRNPKHLYWRPFCYAELLGAYSTWAELEAAA